MAATPLSEEEITQALTTVPLWERSGEEITRTFAFPSYLAGIDFVSRAAQLAEAANHHPDIHIAWRKVTLRLSTHSAHALTKKDFDLAGQIDALV
jgi:4a-hydroxytetrahydrobiopterin dehydratase